MKTTDLKGAALDWAVLAARRFRPVIEKGRIYPNKKALASGDFFSPSRIWAQGGPLIELFGIGIKKKGKYVWSARFAFQEKDAIYGSSPLEAAMRCYVVSKLGDSVELPKELT